ncbi:MAG: hypothetical protein ACO3DK_01325 [Bacteroidia bacterium]
MKKWIVRLSLGFASLFLLLLLLPFAFKNQVVQAAQKTANQSLNAKVSFDSNVHLSFLRHFPNLSVGIESVNITGIDSFDGVELLHADELQVVINLKSLFGDEYEIGGIYADGLRSHIVYLESGKANYDIVPVDTAAVDTADSAPLYLNLDRIELRHSRIVYDDATMDYHLALNGIDLEADGQFKDVKFALNTALQCEALDMSYGGMTLLDKVAVKTETVLDMDLDAFRFGFDVKEILLNELPLTAKGWVQLNDDHIDMDLGVQAVGTEFKNYLSVVPHAYTADFDAVKAAGSAAFSLSLKGAMTETSMPATELKLGVQNGEVQYPGLPAAIKGIGVDFRYTNPDGALDNSVVDLKQFDMQLNASPLSMQLLLTHPESNPYAKGKLDLNSDLSKWAEFLPLGDQTLNGLVNVHAQFEGHYSEMNPESASQLNAEGSLSITGLETQYAGLNLNLRSLKAELNPRMFTLPELDFQWGESRIQGSAQLSNFLGYAFHDETLHGRINAVSQSIDLNEWMKALSNPAQPAEAVSEMSAGEGALEGRVEPSTDSSSLPILPKNLDLLAKATVDRLVYEDYTLENCAADISLKNGEMIINPLQADWMGSRFSLNNTRYSYALGGKPLAALGLNIDRIDPSTLAEHLSLIKAYAPILKNIKGLANLGFSLSSQLQPNMEPDWSSTDAGGLFELFKGAFDVPKWMAKATEPLKLKTDAWELSPTKVGFEISQGMLRMKDSLKITMPEGALMNIKGSVGLDRSLAFGGTIRYQGKSLPFSIGGTVEEPVMKVDFKALGIQMAQPYIDQAKEKKDQAVNEALNKARIEADKIKAEAARQADRIRSEAQALGDKQRSLADAAYQTSINEAQKQADLLVAQAGNPLAKAAAQKAAEKTMREAEKKAKAAREKAFAATAKMEAEAGEKANALEIEASLKADALIKAAEEKAG